MLLASSFSITVRQPVAADGLTQASSVIPLVRSSDAASATVTHALVPLNESAPPNLPAAAHVALEIVPVLPCPGGSVVWTPAPSLKPNAATRPVGVCVVFDTKTSTAAVAALPAASRPIAVSVCIPFDVVVEF